MSQLELFPEHSTKYTKTWCRSCGDKWGDENYMLGVCCGYDLYFNHPMNKQDIEKAIQYEKALEAVLIRASKLKW